MSKRSWNRLVSVVLTVVALCITAAAPVSATIPPPGPSSGSAGLQGTVPTPAPKTPASISTPTNGQVFTVMPITVSGICTTGLLVKVFANNVFVGSAECINGSYSLQVSLFDGRNDIVARVFDSLDQAGPDSNVVTVTFNNVQFSGTGVPQLTLTSAYARRGANPGEALIWPITISGGTAPYAISADWGDGKPPGLSSQQFAGTFNISHTYNNAGVFVVIIKATDKNGQTAFLQLVGQANGAVTQSTTQSTNNGPSIITKTEVLWVPAALMIPFIAVAFWLGRRYELTELRRHLESPEEE
ncbi:MAG TPA: hypothetical protein VKQ34_02475 [Candidatus Saccharimonadales bacterium]|nr:hypothetical protein [Candidatus Saccharimonadales bacterium]